MKRRCGDREIAYDDAGVGAPGAPVVLLHPFPFDRRYWTATAAALAPPYRVITVDARGYGEAPASGPFAIADLADDLAALLDALGVSAATVVGLSMGGYAALAFAQRHPARLAALVLADTRAAADSPETRRAPAPTSIAACRGCSRPTRRRRCSRARAHWPRRAASGSSPGWRRCVTVPTAPPSWRRSAVRPWSSVARAIRWCRSTRCVA
jgi:pimeloyl-ACP methyl ester carboxylesterase